MKYAVIRLKGRQYKVSEGEDLLVDKVASDKISPEVLLVAEGEKVSVGKPTLPGVRVRVQVVSQEKGEKVHVLKYKAKSRYRRRMGFRPIYTKLHIEKISP